jgi:uncharacterized protein YjaZ
MKKDALLISEKRPIMEDRFLKFYIKRLCVFIQTVFNSLSEIHKSYQSLLYFVHIAPLLFGAGYAVDYEVVQSFMKKHNKTIYETSLISSDEIINGSGLFSS